MLLKCKCPGCGETKEYIAEQVGSTIDCFRCGRRFVLQGNRARATWMIASATVAVLVFCGAAAAWYYEAWRWDRFDVHAAEDESYMFKGDPDAAR